MSESDSIFSSKTQGAIAKCVLNVFPKITFNDLMRLTAEFEVELGNLREIQKSETGEVD